MVKDKLTSNDKSPFDIGDQVSFDLEKTVFKGIIEKAYNNSYLIAFKTNDPVLEDKYHDKVVISNKKLKMVKKSPNNSKGKNKPEEENEKK
ncbi:DUF2187 domain-containing protein [Apilactobacillus apisilvae]|uniref:DUF2187 domain-containing protein n=1 Tax=Apilactobacillus apisilvae TaxID=2923364 RepID=A0ABY4PIV9_9LACO|nr:DUF2187 domain-containing protein [Apilactobacillus apisilvae]UQS85600.1 DUF2187 domain-containing protein [Apilactobacillus apisilvae]